jgi:serine/threonine-protein kinase
MLGRTHEVDARSDVWSVGATAFTLISGTFVHDAETPEEVLVFTASRQAISLAEVAPCAPRALVDVVDRALRFDRSERWPTARAMQAGLAEACRCSETTEEPAQDESDDRATPELEITRSRAHLEAAQSPSSASTIRSRPGVTRAARREARWVPAAAVVVALAVAAVAALTAYGSGAREPPTVPVRNTSVHP